MKRRLSKKKLLSNEITQGISPNYYRDLINTKYGSMKKSTLKSLDKNPMKEDNVYTDSYV